MDEQKKEKTDFFLVINKILQINKYMIYDNTTKKFVSKKQKEKNVKSTIEEYFNSNKCKKNKNNTTVRNVSKLRKKKQLNVSKLKNLELKEEKSNLTPSINDILDYNSKNLMYSNHSNKKENQKINFNNISYDTYKRYQTTSSNTRKQKLIKLNTLPSLHSFNQNFFQKKIDYNNLKKKELKNSVSNHKNLIKSKLILSSSTNNYLKDNTNNIKTPSIKLLEDISFDLNNVKKLSNNNSNIIKKNKKINNRKNNNLTNSNFIKINENNFQVDYLKKIFKRKKTKNPTYYLNTNISNTNERFFNNVKKFKNFVSVEEIHIAFVKLIKNQYNLIENQENKKIRKRKNNPDFSNKNSTVIYVKEQYL